MRQTADTGFVAVRVRDRSIFLAADSRHRRRQLVCHSYRFCNSEFDDRDFSVAKWPPPMTDLNDVCGWSVLAESYTQINFSFFFLYE